jgi:uncharacterized protein YecE (DUF72 family)
VVQFGRGDGHGVPDISLPPDDVRTLATLAAAPRGPLLAHAGCPTWANKEWLGTVYPADASDLLVAYGRAFNGIELNTTHYRIPSEDTVRRWRDAVPDDFRFVAKVPQRASHEGDLGAAAEFARVIHGLGPRLGCLFVQLPPSLSPGRAGALRDLLAAMPADVPRVVELRHRAWFADGRLTTFAFDVLAEHAAGAVITDAPGRRDVLHMSLPLPLAVVRFLATTDDAVDHRRLDAWAERIARWRDAGLRELYFWLHAPDNVGAPALVAAFRERFEKATGQPLRAAVPPPGQMRLL